jgi:hypothetical protein
MPIIQLSFPNPLNTSVQVGDNAYFSNPTPVSTTGNPFGGQWTSTTTPHMTNDIDGVIDLGEIVAIIPWDGTNSFIQCDMAPVLFNKYFSSIIAGGCVDDTTSPPLTNSCEGATIYETIDDLLEVAFSDGNHNTYYQNIGITGTSSITGNSVWDTQNPCDGTRVLFAFYNSQLAQSGHTGGISAAQTLNHWINDHGAIGLTATSTYAQFMAVYNQGKYGHSGSTGAPCRCTQPQICTTGSYIMFSKDNKANMSSILGYYASVELRNSSQIKSELFNVGADFFESSK